MTILQKLFNFDLILVCSGTFAFISMFQKLLDRLVIVLYITDEHIQRTKTLISRDMHLNIKFIIFVSLSMNIGIHFIHLWQNVHH